ncbi:MAG: GIY-YIG nuclease family protein [Casimicrobiaceae bacterium]
MNDDEDGGYPRVVSRGRTFVYLLPCRDEDILKAGFSRNPLQRLHALHRRYFDFFDLDRALLIEAERLRDARRIERLFITRFAAARSPAPLVIRDAAAGRTEWFRGVAAEADALAREVAEEEGLRLHSPLRGWLLERFGEHADRLYEWSERLLDSIDYEHFNPAAGPRDEESVRLLRHVLDACTALGMHLQSVVPPRVLLWYEAGDSQRPASFHCGFAC